MDYQSLDQEIEKLIDERFSNERLLARLVIAQLNNLGCFTKDSLKSELEDDLFKQFQHRTIENGTSFTLDDEKYNLKLDELQKTDFALDFDELEYQKLFDEDMAEINTSLKTAIDTVAELELEYITNNAGKFVKKHRSIESKFQKNLRRHWGDAIDLLKLLMIFAQEIGEGFNSQYRGVAAANDDFTFDALCRLHANACQICSEIIVLLEAGLADGANARWRTLHETTVISYFIGEHGDETAERFLSHQHIDTYKLMCRYEEHHSKLNLIPLTNEEKTKVTNMKERLVLKFGNNFKEDYGWANHALQKTTRVTFEHIEKAVNLDPFRPYFKLASAGVHATSKGLFSKMGLFENANVMLAGPSLHGLTDPGINTVYDITGITVNLLATKPSIANTARMSTLSQLGDKARNAFYKAEELVKAELAKRQSI